MLPAAIFWKEATVYVAKDIEKICCTCNYWMGARVVVEDGFIYSPKGKEGVCRMRAGDEPDTATTFPSAVCNTWGRWYGLDLA